MSTPEESGGGRAALVIALAGIVGVSFVGFAIGTSDKQPEGAPIAAVEAGAHEGPVAEVKTYAAMRERVEDAPTDATWKATEAPTGPNAGAWSNVPDSEWGAAVLSRAERRAYDGAPPVVPHPIQQRDLPTCLACHGIGKTVRGAVAVPPSHEAFSSCVQCHVAAVDAIPGDEPPGPVMAANTFVGLQAPTRGERAWPIAPAVVPHPTFMREKCNSCHGPSGRAAIRTSHPWRQSCNQCHPASAAMDQVPVL